MRIKSNIKIKFNLILRDEIERKKSIKKDLIFSKINKKNKDYNLNKNKMRGYIPIFVWPMHIPRPCKRERKKKKNLVTTKPPRITIHAPLYWKHYNIISHMLARVLQTTTLHYTQIKLTCIHKKIYEKFKKLLFTYHLYFYSL
jgi:hypothetical protein